MLQQSALNIFFPEEECFFIGFCGDKSQETFESSFKALIPCYEVCENSKVDLLFCSELVSGALPQLFHDQLSMLKRSGVLFYLTHDAPENQLAIEIMKRQGFSVLANLAVEGDALYDENCDWATFIPRTGKLDYMKRVLTDCGLLSMSKNKRARLSVFAYDESASWLFALLGELGRLGFIDKPIEVGRIDKMRTGNVVVQLMDNKQTKFAVKVLNDDDAKGAISPWLDSVVARAGTPNELRSTIPRVFIKTDFQAIPYQLEAWMSGKPASLYFYHRKYREVIIDNAVDWSVIFLNATRSNDAQLVLDRGYIKSVMQQFAAKTGKTDKLSSRIIDYIEEKLSLHSCPVVSCHGDFWIANMLVDDHHCITGVVDWEFSEEKTFPLIDVLHLIFHKKTVFKSFQPWKELKNTFRGKISVANRARIAKCLRQLNIHTELFASLLLLYWIKYLDTRLPILGGNPGWCEAAFVDIYELVDKQSVEDWNGLGARLAEA